MEPANEVFVAGVKGRSGGHNRKSVEEHRLTGSFRPAGHAQWVRPAATAPKPVTKPATLSTKAVGVWDALAPLALAMGTLTPADVWAFAVLCELQATLEMASSQKNELGSAIKLERETAAAIRPWYGMFGFTPADRARLHIAAPTDEFSEFDHNPLDKFLNRRRAPSKWGGVLD